MSELLTTTEAARVLRLSPQTLATWRCRGDGPKFVRLGKRRVLYLRADLERWVAEGVRRCTSEAAA